MANPDNLTKHRFTSENQPKKRRSRKGIPNRATLLKKWLRSKAAIPGHLLPPGMKTPPSATVEDQMALALITRAVRGNVPAIREVLDSVYGKIKDQHEITRQDGLPITIIQPTVEELKAKWEEERQQFELRQQERMRQVANLDDD